MEFFVLYFLGFLCPVHTPDGAPCGLLNHMSASCQVHILDNWVSRVSIKISVNQSTTDDISQFVLLVFLY